MLKQVFFGILWCVVLYFVVCVLIGAVAGAIAGSRDPANAATAGQQAGANAVAAVRVHIFAGAIVLSALGTWAGVLPGTRVKRSEE